MEEAKMGRVRFLLKIAVACFRRKTVRVQIGLEFENLPGYFQIDSYGHVEGRKRPLKSLHWEELPWKFSDLNDLP